MFTKFWTLTEVDLLIPGAEDAIFLSCIVLLLSVRTLQVPWSGDLDLYFAFQWLWHILRRRRYILNFKAYNHQNLA